ncbi:acetyltransferase family protein [Acinetobacter baumannii 400834]|nr:acetyltransferase family protein [Acinetobacter baumannii 400834]
MKGFLDGYLNPENNIAEIRAFYLLREIQRKGVGRALFQKFYQCALNQGYAFIRLEVFNKNPSRFFYEKMGAKLTGEAELPEFGLGITELFYEWQL